jgi:diguanylate cyclase (GGDEF)-like protein/putative nucleotidyltransferase with HDIG domain
MDSDRPAVDITLGRPAMARTLAWFYLAGATLGGLSLLMPHSSTADIAGMVVVIGIACAVGGVLLAGADRLPEVAIPAFLAGGSLLISSAVYFDGHTSSVYSFYYVWVGVEAFYFLGLRLAALQVSLAGAGYAWALSMVQSDGLIEQRWMLTLGTTLIAGLLVAYQRNRIDRLVHTLTDAARTDPLTGLLNRRGFEETFELELERARRSDGALTVLAGDLDGFKAVNDHLGHQAGDEALQALARDLSKWKRRIDVAARMGGEEFALLLPDTDERGAFLVAERLRRAVQRTFSEHPLPLTISFGVASWPDHGAETELLLRAADEALYAAKDMGRDRTVIYSAEVAGMLSAGAAAERDEMQLATVVGLAETLDIRDTGTARHSQTVGRYARMMAEELGLEPDHVERVRVAGLLHDVGKIGISDQVLTKPGPLETDEWDEVRTHPEIAARLLARPEFADLCSWILSHHERPDGTGYPEGLSGDEIPLEARILAVADAYEAMTADRVYRPALGDTTARAELEAGSGSQFDAEVVQAFVRALDRLEGAGEQLAATATK